MEKKAESKADKTIRDYIEHYNNAYLKLNSTTVANDEMQINGILNNLILAQENYSSRSRDLRNIFFINSLKRSNMIGFDKSLPEKVEIYEYYMPFKNPTEAYYENNEIFQNAEQMKLIYSSFIMRFLKGGIEEHSFFDKIIMNTLIKAKILIRYDSSMEDITTTAKAFFNTAIV